MNKFVRVAQTSQSLSLAAMEEASRLGIREADIDHLFLALVISDQSAGRALRSMGIDLVAARRAVEEQHDAQLASLGIETSFPEAGRIVFHETDGYGWTRRARDLIAESSTKNKAGDAAAVLRELLAEPSGLIADVLARLGATPDDVLEHLDSPVARTAPATSKSARRLSGTSETFVPAPMDEVWELLADPARIPEWEPSIGSIDNTGHDPAPGMVWVGHTPRIRPDGKPVKAKPRFRRRSIEFVSADRPDGVAWSFGYPDVLGSNPVLTELTLRDTPGGTQVQITRSWSRRRGWRGMVALPLRPLQKFIVWISLFQIGSAISRAFR